MINTKFCHEGDRIKKIDRSDNKREKVDILNVVLVILYFRLESTIVNKRNAPGACDSINGMSFRNVSIARPKLIWNSARSFAICCMTGGKFVAVPMVSSDGNFSSVLAVVKVDSSSLTDDVIPVDAVITPLRSFVIWKALIVDDNNILHENISFVTELFIDNMFLITCNSM